MDGEPGYDAGETRRNNGDEIKLTLPRTLARQHKTPGNTKPCVRVRGMLTIFLHLGNFQLALLGNFRLAELRNFQLARIGEFSTGTDKWPRAPVARLRRSPVRRRRCAGGREPVGPCAGGRSRRWRCGGGSCAGGRVRWWRCGGGSCAGGRVRRSAPCGGAPCAGRPPAPVARAPAAARPGVPAAGRALHPARTFRLRPQIMLARCLSPPGPPQ